jgi:hypothetical protein
MLVFNKYFYKNKKSKLYFGDYVAVLNDFIYQTGGVVHSIYSCKSPPNASVTRIQAVGGRRTSYRVIAYI